MSEPTGPPVHPGPREDVLLAVYLRKRVDLLRFFTRRTGSKAAAEDIVQDIYLRLARPTDIGSVQSPEAYLYRLGTNLMLDRVRGMKRRLLREHGWAQLWMDGGVASASDQPASDDVVAARQRMARLLQALESLPPATAMAFRLHKFEGLSHLQVAERLGVSRSTIEKYIIAALRHLLASDAR